MRIVAINILGQQTMHIHVDSRTGKLNPAIGKMLRDGDATAWYFFTGQTITARYINGFYRVVEKSQKNTTFFLTA